MSTADCKALLAKNFPSTSAKEWRRETKYLNFDRAEIRRFSHPVAGIAFVDEEREEISSSDVSLQFRQASKLQAGDFYFSLSMCHGDEAPCNALVSFVHKHHFDTEGFMDSIHLEHVIEKFFPTGIECYEEAESVFAIHEEIPEKQLMEMFAQAGFTACKALDDLISGVSAPRDVITSLEISAASRSLLGRVFPNAQAQYWTPLSKYLNHQGLEVTALYHYVYGQAWIIEETEEVSQDGWWHSLQDVSKLAPGDYWVSTVAGESCVRAFFVLKEYFSRELQTEDAELDFLIGHLPKDLGRLSVEEGSCIEFCEQTCAKAVMNALTASGFGYSEAYGEHIKSEYSGE